MLDFFKTLAFLAFSIIVSAYTITVDSQETVAANGVATNAIDNDQTTIWQTEYTGGIAPFPHYAIVDLGESMLVSGLGYLPRQDGSDWGNIGNHYIEVSSDNYSWIQVAYGCFVNDQYLKNVLFNPVVGRHIRITATSEANEGNGTTSAASLVPVVADVSTAAVSNPATQGRWGLTIDFPKVPVALALLPNGNLLSWSSWRSKDFRWNPIGETQTSTWNPTAATVSQLTITNTGHDMFCPGLSQDANGRVIVTGGNDDFNTSIYTPSASSWASGPLLNIQRGYHSQTLMSDGRSFVIGGSYSITNSTQGNPDKMGEVYDPASNTWNLLPGCPSTPILTNDWDASFRADNHAWLFAWSNGSVFQAGPSVQMHWFHPQGNCTFTDAGPRGNDIDSMCGSAVMYDAVAGKVFTAGGATSYTESYASSNVHLITLNGIDQAPTVTQLPNMNYPRSFHNSILLPNGQIFVGGGQEYARIFNENDIVYPAELWDPNTQTFTVLPQISEPRVYHSAGILLMDGTVFLGGGGLGGNQFPDSINHLNGQIYQPPYLFNADGSLAKRPRIFLFPQSPIAVGAQFVVQASSNVASWALVRLGSSTHTVNTDQRRIPLQTTSKRRFNQYTLTLTLPNDSGIVLPGNWLLFAFSAGGVPSVAKTITVTL